MGSTVGLTDGTGAIVREYTYDPDGNATSTGSGATSELRYAGGHVVGGYYHYAARYYHPDTMRWTQQDPLDQIADLAEANRYAYVGGDPVNSVDPSGLRGAYVEGGCGPLGASCKENSRGRLKGKSSTGAGIKVGLGLKCGASGGYYTGDVGDGDGGGGVQGCAIYCVGYDRDSGFNFGVGPSIGVDVSLG